MDFFQQQQAARRASRLLIVLFPLALFTLVLLVNAGVGAVWWLYQPDIYHTVPAILNAYLHTQTCLAVTLITLVVFGGGSIGRYWQLRNNNTALPHLLNATELHAANASPKARRLINVTAEMAVAAGIPAPRLFVMTQEAAINAFVSGHSDDPVLVVTQGTIEQLSRDELQAIVGHEFSHLLNDDTRLNMRLLIVLAGLMSVGRLGYHLVDMAISDDNGNQWRLSSDSDDMRGFGAYAFLPGLLLLIAGYAGLFQGRLIKAAISRRREMLADAAAYQLTRNPVALASTLMKMRDGPGSLLHHAHAEDINHMCFGDSVRIRFRKLLATHPNMQQRLHHLGRRNLARARVHLRKSSRRKASDDGLPTNSEMGYAQSLVKHIPEALSNHLQDPQGACLVIYALLMNVDRQRFLPAVKEADKHKISTLVEQISKLGSRTRLPLIDLCLPALKRLNTDGKKQLLQNIDWLIKVDEQITLFDYLLRQLVRTRLINQAPAKVNYNRLEQVSGQVQLLLSMLIHQTAQTDSEKQQLFKQFAVPLLAPGRQLLPIERCSLSALAKALRQLRQLGPLPKGTLLDYCADIVRIDGKIQVNELELMRLICAMLSTPLPSLRHG